MPSGGGGCLQEEAAPQNINQNKPIINPEKVVGPWLWSHVCACMCYLILLVIPGKSPE